LFIAKVQVSVTQLWHATAQQSVTHDTHGATQQSVMHDTHGATQQSVVHSQHASAFCVSVAINRMATGTTDDVAAIFCKKPRRVATSGISETSASILAVSFWKSSSSDSDSSCRTESPASL
jgi:hypothetical protein